MSNLFSLLLIVVNAMAGLFLDTDRSSQTPLPSAARTAMTTPTLVLTQVTLIAREQQRLLIGQSPSPDRPVGFASLFLHVENHQEADATLTIQRIEIQDVATGAVKLVSQSPQTILLRPLENAVNAIHLTNTTGYGNCDRVKAVVTYQIGERAGAIESNVIAIERI